MDAEEGKPHVLPEKAVCAVPEIESVAKSLGITCQAIFQRAYRRVRHPPSFARAVFARFLATAHTQRVLPEVVAEYCKSRRIRGGAPPSNQSGFCIGCMMTREGTETLAYWYPLIHEQSRTADQVATNMEPMSELDKLWLDLMESGALEESEEGIADLIKQLGLEEENT